EKMREGFEAWLESRLGERSAIVRVDDGYLHLETEVAWQAWQASRAAVVIELPEERKTNQSHAEDRAEAFGFNDGIERCREVIEAAGVGVK
ncbi:hypothetical protein, partial [Pseudomonas sp.]|uniref:hypothetical protein n=1 Tax=Pseudomonas sp. TaxID=306 RepID=UPI0025885E71